MGTCGYTTEPGRCCQRVAGHDGEHDADAVYTERVTTLDEMLDEIDAGRLPPVPPALRPLLNRIVANHVLRPERLREEDIDAAAGFLMDGPE